MPSANPKMAGCRVCNEQTEPRYDKLTMAKFRNRLQKVMEEQVPEDSVICSLCQFDLEKIEMYYCLLKAFKKRYWDAAEVRKKFPEGYVAPANRNILVETFRARTSHDVSEGRKAETTISMGVHSMKREAPATTQQIVGSITQIGDGLELGCWSEGPSAGQEGSENHQGNDSQKVISALNLYSVKNGIDKSRIPTISNKDKRGYFFYEGSNITDQILKAPEKKTWLHVPLKRRVGRPRKHPVLNVKKIPGKRGRPRKNPLLDVIKVKGKRGRPRKNPVLNVLKVPGKPGRPRKNPDKDGVSCTKMFLSQRDKYPPLVMGPKKRGRPPKNPQGNLGETKLGRPNMNNISGGIAVVRKPGRPQQYTVGKLIVRARNAGRSTIKHVAHIVPHTSLAGPRKRGRPKKQQGGSSIAQTRIPGSPRMNCIGNAVQPALGSPKKRGRPPKNPSLDSLPVPDPTVRLGHCEVDLGTKVFPIKPEPNQENGGQPTRKKRGRPRKSISPGSLPTDDSLVGFGHCQVNSGLTVVPIKQEHSQEDVGQSIAVAPKKRGRPCKSISLSSLTVHDSLVGLGQCEADSGLTVVQMKQEGVQGDGEGSGTQDSQPVTTPKKRGRPRKCLMTENPIENPYVLNLNSSRDSHRVEDVSESDFLTSGSMVHHEKNHREQGERERFICTICGKALITKYYLKFHMARHKARKQTNMYRKFDNLEKFVCTICGKAVGSKYYLKHHMALHTGKGRYNCSLCGRVCPSESAFNIHMRVHANKKLQQKCHKCGKVFTERYALTIHMRVHEDKNFKCHCGMSLDERWYENHLKTKTHAKLLAKRKSQS